MTHPNPFSLAGRHVLVTGGHKGLGRAMTEAIADAGAQVTVTARHEEDARRAAAELREAGHQAHGVRMEVRDQDDVARAFGAAEDELGPVTGLVNNAGVSIGATALETSDETWRTVLDTNLDGVWHNAREFARRLERANRGGTIVNIGSMSAYIVNRPRWQAPYLASKAAVHQLTRALAAEWGVRRIRVNAIAPGYFLTDMSRVDQPHLYDLCIEPTALKRYGLPHELGPAAVFLLADASSFMTGGVVDIDGGYTLF